MNQCLVEQFGQSSVNPEWIRIRVDRSPSDGLLMWTGEFELFAATLSYLQQLFLICSNFILFAATFYFAACPLWVTVQTKFPRLCRGCITGTISFVRLDSPSANRRASGTGPTEAGFYPWLLVPLSAMSAYIILMHLSMLSPRVVGAAQATLGKLTRRAFPWVGILTFGLCRGVGNLT